MRVAVLGPERLDNLKDLAKKIFIIASKSNNSEIGLDIESDGLDFRKNKLLSLQLGIKIAGDVLVFVILGEENITEFFRHLSNYEITAIGHNLKFDLKFLVYKSGIYPKRWRFFDTMLGHRLTCVGGKNCGHLVSLQDLLLKYLGVEISKEERKLFENADELSSEMINYAARDVVYLQDLKDAIADKLEKVGHTKVAELEFRVLLPVVSMEINGIKVDKQKFLETANNYYKKYFDTLNRIAPLLREEILKKYSGRSILEVADDLNIPVKRKRDRKLLENIKIDETPEMLIELINIASPKQLLAILNKLYSIDVNSTSEKSLKMVLKSDVTDKQRKIIDLLLEMRHYLKRYTSFGEKFVSRHIRDDNRIYAEFHQLGTDTGRFSSSSPNMQQIPAEEHYRNCFIASDGYKIITADYSQMELRLMADVSKEKKMIDAFNKGEDLHKLTASIIYHKPIEEVTKQERKIAKSVNFAIIYGTTYRGLMFNLDLDEKTAKEILHRYFSSYTNLAAFIKLVRNKIWEKRYSITPFGRKRFFDIPDVFTTPREKNKIWNAVTREGLNHIIQGGSADVVKIALVNLFYNNPFGEDMFRILLQVHDEFVVEVHESIAEDAAEFVKSVMLESFSKFLKYTQAKVNASVSDHWEKD